MTTHYNFVNNNLSNISDHNDANDCDIIGWNTTIPWDNPKNVISLKTKDVIEKVVSAIVIGVLFLIGAPANILNMVVFFKQGLGQRINLCLFCLALVDLLFLMYVLVPFVDSFYGYLTDGRYGMIHIYMVNNNVIGLAALAYASQFISTVIATERCACVLFPLRARRCVPIKHFGIMMVIGMCVTVFIRFVVTAKYRAACFYEIRANRISWQTSVSEYYFQNKEMLNILDGIFYGFCLTVGCPVIVLITTIITAIKLRKTVRWRHRASTTMSDKEIGVTKMLIWLSAEFFVLSIPAVILRLSPMFHPQLNAGGHYSNMYMTLVSFAYWCACTNTSVNFFVFYFTGSKYKETLHRLLSWKPSSLRLPGQSIYENKEMETRQTNHQ